MSLKAQDVRRAVNSVAADPANDFSVNDLLEAARRFRPVLLVLWSRIPWWKKIIIGLKALLGALDDYLEERD